MIKVVFDDDTKEENTLCCNTITFNLDKLEYLGFHCELCDRKFKTQSGLQIHLKSALHLKRVKKVIKIKYNI